MRGSASAAGAGERRALAVVHEKQREHLILKAGRAPLLRGRAERTHRPHTLAAAPLPHTQKVPCLINIPKAESQPLSAPSHPRTNFFYFFFFCFFFG